jgi:predicted pyridoxine 5'-phosphate oxidase superfamily flavin-nucleotide-binding protein
MSGTIPSPFHPGELELQRRAGALDEARDLGRMLRSAVPPGAARVLAEIRLAIASSLDEDGRVWASPLTGPAGFVRVVDERLLHLAARPAAGDPLAADLAVRPELGLLAIDLRTRRRLRFNGRGLLAPEGVFLSVEQAYGNCPKYIQRRDPEPDGEVGGGGAVRVSPRLDRGHRARIEEADTLFLASFHPQGGADASHRGGRPGFVRVLGEDLLEFDDYPGNGMFNTLGNLTAYDRAGVLFLDLSSGSALQLTGRAEVRPDFSVGFRVEEAREAPAAVPLRMRFAEYSSAIPKETDR